jgi:hypothetical protein
MLVRKYSKGFLKDQFHKYKVGTDSTVLFRSCRFLKIHFPVIELEFCEWKALPSNHFLVQVTSCLSPQT